MEPISPIALTARNITNATRPDGKDQVLIPIVDTPGLYLRLRRRAHGPDQKTLVVRYRAAGGESRFLRLGDATSISPKAARDAARAKLGEIAKGADPSGEKRAARKAERRRVREALDRYEADLEARQVVKRGEYLSLLRRELLGPLGNIDLAEIDRVTLAERVKRIEASGRPGTAKELKVRANVFLGWCVGEGLIPANPLAGWRRPRATKAQRLTPSGRALADRELPVFWRATEATNDLWFTAYLRLLLLLGQRRTESAAMRWQDLDLDRKVWTIPAAVTKSGREHVVPLPTAAVDLLRRLPRMAHSDLVFPGRNGRQMSGWSKRLRPVYSYTTQAGLQRWTLHDLRRTMRSGLGALGVDQTICELMLNHAISDDLAKLYDRHEYRRQRAEAAERWARHVLGLVRGPAGNVVNMKRA